MLETIEKYWKETEIYMYIWSALLVVMGILLIVKPDFVMTFISCLIGIVMVVGGISSIIQFFAIGKDETGNYPVRKIIIGILLIIIGIYIVARPQILVSIAGVILAVFLIVYGVYELIWSFQVHFISGAYRLLCMLAAICAVVVGVMFLFSPSNGSRILTQFAGILLLYSAICSVYFHIVMSKTVNEVKKTAKKAVKQTRKEVEEYLDDADDDFLD